MSPASYLTAPPRVAGTIVALVVTFWIALAVLLVGVVGGLVYAVLRGISLWRQFKRTSRSFEGEVARIETASTEIQTHLDRASASNAKLGAAAERLAVSRARLEIQLQAIREARHTMRRVLWFLPGI
jgi:biopolymer transport protein ExbB/TolQ